MPTILPIRRLLWMGHVWRMDSLRLPQIILNWDPVHERPDAKRPVGGQKLPYTDLIEDDLKFLRLSCSKQIDVEITRFRPIFQCWEAVSFDPNSSGAQQKAP